MGRTDGWWRCSAMRHARRKSRWTQQAWRRGRYVENEPIKWNAGISFYWGITSDKIWKEKMGRGNIYWFKKYARNLLIFR